MTARRELVIVGALLLAAVLRMASTYRVFSEVADEPMHVSAGLEVLTAHRYTLQTANPPLPRLVFALGPWMTGARLSGDLPFPGIFNTFYSAPYPRTLILARAGNLIFFLIAAMATWMWARRELGAKPGLIALLFFTTEPIVLGHSALATHDTAATAGLAVSLLALSRWIDAKSSINAAAAGAAFGFAVLCKFSSLLFVPAAIAAVLILRRTAVPWRHVAIAGITCGAVIVAGYGFSPSKFVEGVKELAAINRSGHEVYLNGHRSHQGWWYYFPEALALKTSFSFLAATLIGLVTARRSRNFWIAMAAALLILGISMTSTLDLGVRYVMPMFVPLAYAVSIGVSSMLVRSRLWRAAAVALMVAQAGLSAAAHPDYVAYFNALAGPSPSQYLIDSNVDWGQDIRRLGDVLRELHVNAVHLAALRAANLDVLGFPRRIPVDAWTPVHGWVAVSEHSYRYFQADGESGWRYLRGLPYRRVGKSIRLYNLP